MGVVSALMRFAGVNLLNDEWLQNSLSQVLSLVAYVCLITYFVLATRKSRK